MDRTYKVVMFIPDEGEGRYEEEYVSSFDEQMAIKEVLSWYSDDSMIVISCEIYSDDE